MFQGFDVFDWFCYVEIEMAPHREQLQPRTERKEIKWEKLRQKIQK